ncbi:pyridoxal phosphate-dependent deaminase [Vibrio sp. JCM 19236]|nr:pyridoxal phosphate-dependent deaminase [Vibrio sp. JCM 19236]
MLPWLENNSGKELLYLHQGGILGNETMLPRYQRKLAKHKKHNKYIAIFYLAR